jgi:ABC-type transport system substrate-binding protein
MLRFFTALEKVLVVFLILVMVITGTHLYFRFIREHSELSPTDGGIVTEGMIGKPMLLNPLLLMGNPVDRDIAELLFSGLTRYNPHTGQIEDDLATSEKSKDNLTYTFTIVPDATWHDGEPVTADDVIFTYRNLIQNPAFENTALRQTFADVKIEKIGPRTVQFRLNEPYSFFLTNVTVGIVPRHLLDTIPVENLRQADFHHNPIGSGPYQFASWNVVNDTHEITLKRFDAYYSSLPKVQNLIFRVFPNQDALLLAENSLTSFRLSSGDKPDDAVSENSRFRAYPYRPPQYSALFLNTDTDILANKKTRFGLLLATNKEEFLTILPDSKIVDTPILESTLDIDVEFNLERARGALFDAGWYLPEKLEKERKERKEGKERRESKDSRDVRDYRDLKDAAELSFELVGTEDSWISVSLDKRAITSELIKKGAQKSFVAKDSLTFTTIGNAGGISMTVNGWPLKSLGKSGEVLRNLALTRKTLETWIDSSFVPPPPPAPSPPNEPHEPHELNEPSPASSDLQKIRISKDGKRLVFRLITAQEPAMFLSMAELVKKQWLLAGVNVVIESYAADDLQEKIAKRDYDVLLFGQNLGYNLDAYPFWHSSQAERGLNLSRYRSLEADNLLVDIRKTFDERTKQNILQRLEKVIAADTPAIFLTSPTQYYFVDRSVKNVELKALASNSDRLTDLQSWYVKEEYQLRDSVSVGAVMKWLFSW